MTHFIWTPELSIGINEIDEEHMRWIAYINALHAGVEKGKEQTVLTQLLDDVINFSTEHFKHEEEMFSQTSYPDTEHHKTLHKEYLAELKNLKERLANEDADILTYDVMLSLKKWLINHVQDVDRQYVAYIKEKTNIE